MILDYIQSDVMQVNKEMKENFDDIKWRNPHSQK